jgi:hypothetical protein
MERDRGIVTGGFWNPDIYVELEKRSREDKMLKPLNLAVIFSVTLLLRVLDWVTTGIALARGCVELNPLQSQLLAMGPLCYFAVQALGTVAVSLLLWVSSRYMELKHVLVFDTLLLLFPVLNNLALIALG